MTDVSYELQIEIVTALKDSVDLMGMGASVYDRVPPTPVFPYISFGPEQEVPELSDDCLKASELFIQLDIWSRKPGFGEVKNVADLVRRVLDGLEVELNSNALLIMEFDGRRVLRDPDGLTSHAALTFRALIEHA